VAIVSGFVVIIINFIASFSTVGRPQAMATSSCRVKQRYGDQGTRWAFA